MRAIRIINLPNTPEPFALSRLALAILLLTTAIGAAHAQAPIQLVLKDHKFSPDQITVPSGQRFQIEMTNQDSVVAELESSDMKFEKIAVPGGKIRVFAGPLHPGTYKFFDDYDPHNASGTITATAPQ